MRCIFILFDSLNRACIPPYAERDLPAFKRLAERGTVFNNHFAGSLPCIPARREIHTGRLNFLHRGWGPLEPFDKSFADELRSAGTYTHLITDHYHYFEDGGAGYHGRYDTYEFVRGQEKDKWRSLIAPGTAEYQERFEESQRDPSLHPDGKAAYYANHRALTESGDFPLTQCFDRALDFVGEHAGVDNWFLHLECFDPHEPFFLGEGLDETLDADLLGGRIFDWPAYGRNTLEAGLLSQLRRRYEALVARCDTQLGRLLDVLDSNGMWEDTMVVLTTDHGLLLGEKEFLGKNRPPFFNEVAQIPLFVAVPESLAGGPRQVNGLTQTIDLMPTFLDIFGAKPSTPIGGRSLLPLLAGDADRAHEGVLYGQFGGALNYTDGRYTAFFYPRPDAGDLYQYTLMPAHMRSHFEQMEFEGAELVDDLAYARGFPVMRLKIHPDAKANMIRRYPLLDANDVIYDLASDPGQETPLNDPAVRDRCCREVLRLLAEHEAPAELTSRFAFEITA